MGFRTEQLAEGVTLICGDAREVVPTLSGIDCVVTSPPYGQQREYGKKIDDWRALVSSVLCNVPDSGETQVLVNLGLVHKDGHVVAYWDPFIADMKEAGWRLFGWYVWDKCDGMGGDWNGRLAPAHEWVFHFNRSARQVNKVFHSKTAGLIHKGNPGLKGADGQSRGYSHSGRAVQEFKVPDSVVRVHPERHNYEATEHPAVFPTLLPQVLIDAYTDNGQQVLDPFLGSGTSALAAIKLGRRFVGIEIHPPYFDLACRRIEAALKQPDMFIALPRPAEQLSILDGDAA